MSFKECVRNCGSVYFDVFSGMCFVFKCFGVDVNEEIHEGDYIEDYRVNDIISYEFTEKTRYHKAEHDMEFLDEQGRYHHYTTWHGEPYRDVTRFKWVEVEEAE